MVVSRCPSIYTTTSAISTSAASANVQPWIRSMPDTVAPAAGLSKRPCRAVAMTRGVAGWLPLPAPSRATFAPTPTRTSPLAAGVIITVYVREDLLLKCDAVPLRTSISARRKPYTFSEKRIVTANAPLTGAAAALVIVTRGRVRSLSLSTSVAVTGSIARLAL